MITTVRNLLLWMFEDTFYNVSNHMNFTYIIGFVVGFVVWLGVNVSCANKLKIN